MSTGLRLRPAIFAARETLAAGRAQLKKQHRQGESGTHVSRQLAELMESLVRDLFDVSLQDALAENATVRGGGQADLASQVALSLKHISEPTRHLYIAYALFCCKK